MRGCQQISAVKRSGMHTKYCSGFDFTVQELWLKHLEGRLDTTYHVKLKSNYKIKSILYVAKHSSLGVNGMKNIGKSRKIILNYRIY